MIVRDLIGLGEAITAPEDEFDLDYRSDATALGIAWVLAGSSLGNRAMLHDMKEALPHGSQWPHTFLSSDAMSEFWKGLRQQVEAPAAPGVEAEAVRAATAAFAHFLDVSSQFSSDDQLEEAQ